MSPEEPKEGAGSVPSIISPELEIVGDLKSDGEIQIDGTVKGDIKGHVLTVGEQGKIDGSTVAETVRIFGTVNGRVQAKTPWSRGFSSARYCGLIRLWIFSISPFSTRRR